MGKRWILALTVVAALGLIGLLAYTSESVHRAAEPPEIGTEVARPQITPAPAEREMGPTVNSTGLMLTY